MSEWNDARHDVLGWKSNFVWACTTAPVVEAVPLPGRRETVPRVMDDVIFPRWVAERKHTSDLVVLSPSLRVPRQIGWPGPESCTRCAGSERVFPVSVSGVGSIGRSSNSSSNSSSEGSSFSHTCARQKQMKKIFFLLLINL